MLSYSFKNMCMDMLELFAGNLSCSPNLSTSMSFEFKAHDSSLKHFKAISEKLMGCCLQEWGTVKGLFTPWDPRGPGGLRRGASSIWWDHHSYPQSLHQYPPPHDHRLQLQEPQNSRSEQGPPSSLGRAAMRTWWPGLVPCNALPTSSTDARMAPSPGRHQLIILSSCLPQRRRARTVSQSISWWEVYRQQFPRHPQLPLSVWSCWFRTRTRWSSRAGCRSLTKVWGSASSVLSLMRASLLCGVVTLRMSSATFLPRCVCP